jgi:hypothetical protein
MGSQQQITLAVFKASTNLLIDAVGVSAAVAYGLRRLRAAYSGAGLRVRRASDNAEQDIGFSGEGLDWADAISFKGASTIFVTTWYDQSTNGNNAVQATSANQPELDTTNSRIVFDGTNDALKTASNVTIGGKGLSLFLVRQFASLAGTQMVAELGHLDQEGAGFFAIGGAGERRWQIGDDAITYNRKENTSTNTTLKLDSLTADKSVAGGSGETGMFENGDSTGNTSGFTGNTSQDFAAARFHLGHRDVGGASLWYNGSLKEAVLFPSLLGSTPRNTAQDNINAFHAIY